MSLYNIGKRVLYRGFPNKSSMPIRHYKVLSIETSCDDTCIALLEKNDSKAPPKIIDQVKSTLNSVATGGIIPTDALRFHQTTLALLIETLLKKHNCRPDLICCTRGPGMAGSLSAGLQLSKGLAVAWGVPLIGVHHMLGHILVATLPKSEQPDLTAPQYPFLSLLCSGGHTMLVLLKSITDHEIIANTADIAVGDSLDKCARELGLKGVMLGRELESYVNSIKQSTIQKFDTMETKELNLNSFKYKLGLPLKGPRREKYPKDIVFAFAGFLSSIQSYKKDKGGLNVVLDQETREFISYKLQEHVFDHIIDRMNLAFTKHGSNKRKYEHADGKFLGVKDLIFSGGVASNQRLREKLATRLQFQDNDGEVTDLNLHFPDLSLCTDNAVMIGVAGIEIFESLRIKSDLGVCPIPKWPMDSLLDVEGWVNVTPEEYNQVIQNK